MFLEALTQSYSMTYLTPNIPSLFSMLRHYLWGHEITSLQEAAGYWLNYDYYSTEDQGSLTLLDESITNGKDDRLCAVFHLNLLQNAMYMRLDRTLSDKKLASNLLIP